jgi:hypothetical protein
MTTTSGSSRRLEIASFTYTHVVVYGSGKYLA